MLDAFVKPPMMVTATLQKHLRVVITRGHRQSNASGGMPGKKTEKDAIGKPTDQYVFGPWESSYF